MILSWLKNRRRRRLLQTPLPESWDAHWERIAVYRVLPEKQRGRLRDAARIFVSEKTFEGCKGLEVTEEMQVTIATLACVLVLGLADQYFDHVYTILVYPSGFLVPRQRPVGGDVALETQTDVVGEAHYRGPVLLSWDEVEQAARLPGDGYNPVYHEFAHQLDMQSGEADGVPPLPRELRARWQEVMGREYKKLCRAADRGRRTLLDPYGATDPAEFFAVVTEAFFDLPRPLQEEHPELYAVLREYYGQDPAAWPWP